MSLHLLPLKLHRIFKKRKMKKSLYKLRRYIKSYKLSFIFYFNNFFYKYLNNSKKKILRNIYVRDFFRLITRFYNSIYKKQEIDIHNGYYCPNRRKLTFARPSEDETNASLKVYRIDVYDEKKRKKHREKYNETQYEEALNHLDTNENYVIDLYDETSLPHDLQLIYCDESNDKTSSFDYDSVYKETHYGENSRNNESETCSYENLEYDEDEANESIKNCYLYNGYINAATYKKSDEYKFLRECLALEKNDSLKINIETDSENEYAGGAWEKRNIKKRITKRLRNREIRKKKKTKYEIYNSEITEKQNLYCTNYLNENFNSSSSFSSVSCSCLSDISSDENIYSGSEKSNAYTNSSYFENESMNDYVENSSTCSDDSAEST